MRNGRKMKRKFMFYGSISGVIILVLAGLFSLSALSWAQSETSKKHSKSDQQPRVNSNVPRPIVNPQSAEKMNRMVAGRPDRIPVGMVSKRRAIPTVSAALSWTNLGPQPVEDEYWSGNADASGRICAVLVDPDDSNIIYIAGAQGGVWKSIDNGVNWMPLTDHLSSLSSGDLAFDPFDSDIIYYGTGELHYASTCVYGDGLFKTTDGGTSWTKIASASTVGSYIPRIIVKPTASDTLHLATDLGYLRSTDSGANWTLVMDYDHCNDLAISPVAPNVVFAAIRSDGIYKSINDGASFVKLAGGLPTSGFGRINMAISPSNPLVLYASFVDASSGGLYGMYKTTDGGTNWTHLTNTPNYLRSQGWFDNCIIIHPTNTLICYAGGVFPFGVGDYGMIKTVDGGANWTDITIGSTGQGTNNQLHPDHHCLAIESDGTLWVGCDGGLWKTTDGGANWINRNHNLGLTQFYTVAVHPTDSNFLVGGTQDQGAARFDGSLGWPQLNAGDGGPCAVEWDSPNIYYTTYVFLDPLYKWNNGVYQGIVTGPWSGDRASWCNGALVVDQNQANTLLAGTYRVFRTTNSGTNWTNISGDLTGGSGHLRSLAVANGASNTIYSGSSNGRVYVTTDASTWNLRNSGLPSSPIPDIVLNPSDWQEAYLCVYRSSGGRVFHTANAGVSWTDITGDLPDGLRGMSLALHFTMPPTLYLGTDYGVYSTSNGGTNWVEDSSGLPSMEIYGLGLDRANNLLVASTHGRGMYRASLPENFSKTCVLDHSGDECQFDVSVCSEIKFEFEYVASDPPCMNVVVDRQKSDGSWRREVSWTYNNGETHTLDRKSGTGLYRIVSDCNRSFSVTMSCNDGSKLLSTPSSPWNLPGYVIGSNDGSSEDLGTIVQSLLSIQYTDTFDLSIYPKFLGNGYVDTLVVYFPFDSIRAGWEGNVKMTVDAIEVYPSEGDYIGVRITAPGAPKPGPHELRLYPPISDGQVHICFGEIAPDPLNPIEVILETYNGYIELDGIYITTTALDYTPVEPGSLTMPTAFSLAQNYPNPFNPTTEVKYNLPVDCHVKLEIYNVLGQKVAVLANGYLKAGYKTARWNGIGTDGSPVSSGIYFYRLQAGSFVDVKKMVLIK